MDFPTEEDPGTNADQPRRTAQVSVTGLDENAKYKVIGYGYNGDEFPYTIDNEGSLVESEDYYLATSIKTAFEIEEVFAGNDDAETTTIVYDTGAKTEKYIKFKEAVKVELHRQVAGMLAYFDKVPAKIGDDQVKTIKVVANAKTTGFYFPADLLNNEEFNGYNQQGSEDVLLTFDVSEATDSDNDGLLEFGTNEDGKRYQLAEEMPANDKLVCADNTLFGGRFILPYATHVSGSNTLVIRIKGEDKILDEKVVRTPQTVTEGDEYHFDIRCNNFYSIGTKMDVENTDGGGTPDKPQSLTSETTVLVNIHDDFRITHQLVIE